MKKILILSMLIFSGCMTLTNNKSLLIPPSDKATMVESYATAHCQDMLIIEYCTLDNQMKSSQGK